jgi:ADP-ribose pyrophosphatase
MRKIKFSAPTVSHSNPFMEIRHTHADFGSFSKDYYVVHFGPRVGVVALNQDKLLLVRQYRFLVNDLSWEIPGGKVEPEETPEVAGARECLEETGVRCTGLKKLVAYYPGLDNVENRTTLLYTEEAQPPAKFVKNDAEVEEIAWIPFGECLQMVFEEKILDALTVVGILSYAAHRAAAPARAR